jgi:phosphatidylglycerophosphate synthase
MFDNRLRKQFAPAIDGTGRWLARRGVSAIALTAFGFVAGVAGCVALAFRFDDFALICLVLNRLSDLLDGAVARATRVTDFGGFADIVGDLIVYSGFVLGFAIGRPEHAIAAASLIFTFVATGSSFLAAAIIAAKRNVSLEPPEKKSFFYNAAIAEGTETAIVLALICLFPNVFDTIAYIFLAVCWLSVAGHLRFALKYR